VLYLGFTQPLYPICHWSCCGLYTSLCVGVVWNVSGLQQALLTAKYMLSLWRALYEDQTNIELPDQSERRSDTRSVFQLYTSEMSDKDSSKYVNKLYGVKNCSRALQWFIFLVDGTLFIP